MARRKAKRVAPHKPARKGQKCKRCGRVHSRSAHWSHTKNHGKKWHGRKARPQTKARRTSDALRTTRKALRSTRKRATAARMAIGEMAFMAAARKTKASRSKAASSKAFARAVAAGNAPRPGKGGIRVRKPRASKTPAVAVPRIPGT